MVKLYLIRHAEAVPHGDPNYEDDDRPLLELGRRQARALGAALLAQGIRFDTVLSSPLPRALSTAEELLVGMGDQTREIHLHKELAPGCKPRKLDRLLLKNDSAAIALVGHQPDLGLYAGRLIGSKRAGIVLDKPGVACIECSDPPGKGSGELRWLVNRSWMGAGVREPIAESEEPIMIAKRTVGAGVAKKA